MEMSKRSHPVSLVIIGFVFLTLISIFGLVGYLVATGSASVNAEISLIGTIPVDYLIIGVFAFVGWMVYNAFVDVYGSEQVEESTEQYESMVSQTNSQIDNSSEDSESSDDE